MASENMSADSLAGRYAAALFELAADSGVLDDVAEDLKRLGGMIQDNADLKRVIRSPVISRRDQGRAMTTLLQKAEMGDLVTRFVGVLAMNRRLFALPDMIAVYLELLAGKRGEVTAHVLSAKKLTERQLKNIGESLEKAVGKTVSIDAQVDAGLLGGLVVKIGSRMVDSSLRTKLQHLRLAMKGIG